MSRKNKKEGWNDPQPTLKVVYKSVINKSKAGVEYENFVPTIEGTFPTGMNRRTKRRRAAFERSVMYKEAIEREQRKAKNKRKKLDDNMLKLAKEKLEK